MNWTEPKASCKQCCGKINRNVPNSEKKRQRPDEPGSPTSPPWRRAGGSRSTTITLNHESELSPEYTWPWQGNLSPADGDWFGRLYTTSVLSEGEGRNTIIPLVDDDDDDDEMVVLDPVGYLRTQPSDKRLFVVGMAVPGVSRCYNCFERHKVTCLECHNSSVRDNNGNMQEIRCPKQGCDPTARQAFVDNSPLMWIPTHNRW